MGKYDVDGPSGSNDGRDSGRQERAKSEKMKLVLIVIGSLALMVLGASLVL